MTQFLEFKIELEKLINRCGVDSRVGLPDWLIVGLVMRLLDGLIDVEAFRKCDEREDKCD